MSSSTREDMNIKGSSDLSVDDSFPNQYVQEQAEFLENMKKFLLTQQSLLRQNLENVRTKAGTTSVLKKIQNGHSAASADPSTTTSPVVTSPTVAKEIEADGLHGKSPTLNPPKLSEIDIQICPVCGMEFDVGDDLESLETHVAGHWCSSETE